MEDCGGNRQFPVALIERSDDGVLPVGSQQVRDCGRRLHRMFKIVERSIAGLEFGIISVKQVKRKGDQTIAKARLRFTESLSRNSVDEFRSCEITLGMKHLIGC